MPDEITYTQLLGALKAETIRWFNTDNQFTIPEDYYVNHKEALPWFPAALALMWLTGGRVSEVLKLRGRDIVVKPDPDGTRVATIYLMNLKQHKDVVPTKKCIVIIDHYQEAWQYVEDYINNLINPTTILFHRKRGVMWWHCKRVFGLGTHRCGRHSFVMNAARAGAGILDIKQIGGWSRLQSMDNYIHEFGTREMTDRLKRLKVEHD